MLEAPGAQGGLLLGDRKVLIITARITQIGGQAGGGGEREIDH